MKNYLEAKKNLQLFEKHKRIESMTPYIRCMTDTWTHTQNDSTVLNSLSKEEKNRHALLAIFKNKVEKSVSAWTKKKNFIVEWNSLDNVDKRKLLTFSLEVYIILRELLSCESIHGTADDPFLIPIWTRFFLRQEQTYQQTYRILLEKKELEKLSPLANISAPNLSKKIKI